MEACGGICRGCGKVLEACVDACVELYCRGMWIGVVGGDRVLEACRMVVGTMTDAYKMSQGGQKKRGGVGAGTSPWKDYVRNNLPVCWVGWVSLHLVDKQD